MLHLKRVFCILLHPLYKRVESWRNVKLILLTRALHSLLYHISRQFINCTRLISSSHSIKHIRLIVDTIVDYLTKF